MGRGAWSGATYAATTASSIAAGTSFGYSKATSHKAFADREVHESLRPWNTANSGPYEGKIVREARDSDEHPNSLPAAIFFDETGSMGSVPVELQKRLPAVHGLLQRSGVEDPQILIGAYGDGDLGTEVASLQAGQFESDNKADEDLDNLYLEGNGGGNGHETAALAWWYIARYGQTDAWDKRSKKGYIVTIGDETTGGVTPQMAERYVQDKDHGLQAAMTPAEVVAFASERWEIFHLIINNWSAQAQGSVDHYTKLLGDHAIVLQSHENVAEVIASLIAVNEGVADLDDVLADLTAIGSGDARGEVSKALAKVGSNSKGAVATADAPEFGEDNSSDRF